MYNKILKSLKVRKLGNLEFPNYKKKKPTHFISPTGHT